MADIKNNILFGIVTYKEKYWECDSFNSLMESYLNFKDATKKLNVYVFDNTDLLDWNIEKTEFASIDINYFHQNDNKGISFAYNHISEFAKKNDFEWIVLLDQDSKLDGNCFNEYVNKSIDVNQFIAVPRVYSNNVLISPSIYKYYRSKLIDNLESNIVDFKNVSCINSGIIIKTQFFHEVGGYSTKLRLDFCDHEFIERVGKKINTLEVLNFNINQNFSSETDDKAKAVFRYKLFVKDIKAYALIKKSYLVKVTVDFPHLIKLTLKYKSLDFIKIRFNI
jgi:GT2 family glycosyltransferase